MGHERRLFYNLWPWSASGWGGRWRRRRGTAAGCHKDGLDFGEPGDLRPNGLQAGAKYLDSLPAFIAEFPPFLFTILADSVTHLCFGERLFGGTTFAIELSLRRMLPFQLFADRGTPPSQLLHDRLEPRLVIPSHALAHSGRCLVARRIETEEPLLVL